MISPSLTERRFRRARPDEAEALTAIAMAGKAHWGYPPEWLEAWREDLTLTRDYLAKESVCVAEGREGIVGFFGFKHLAGQCHLEHLWLRPEFIGRGWGRILFEEAVRVARESGVGVLKIKADPNAEAFYLKMGAHREGLEVYQLLGKHRREVPLLEIRL